MNQMTLSDLEYANRRKRSRREKFLDTMERILPWNEWTERIRPRYYSGRRGRKPIALETILRMYFIQRWYHLSAAGVEDMVYDSYAFRSFLKVDFLSIQVPDSTTLLRFKRFLEKEGLEKQILEEEKNCIKKENLIFHAGMMTDAFLSASAGHAGDGTVEND